MINSNVSKAVLLFGLFASGSSSVSNLFAFAQPLPLNGRAFYFSTDDDSGTKYMEVPGASHHSVVNLEVGGVFDRGTNQRFRLELVSGTNVYRIKAVHSGKCLDVKWGSHDEGMNVIQYGCHDGDNQKWRLTGVGWDSLASVYYTFMIQSVRSGKYLDVNYSREVVQSSNRQVWRLEDVLDEGTFVIIDPRTTDGQALTVSANSSVSGANVEFSPPGSDSSGSQVYRVNQRFVLLGTDLGRFEMRGKNSGECVGIGWFAGPGGGGVDDSVRQHDCSRDSVAKRWIIALDDNDDTGPNRYYIQSQQFHDYLGRRPIDGDAIPRSSPTYLQLLRVE